MDLLAALAATLALVALSLGAGALCRSRTRGVRRSQPAAVHLHRLLACAEPGAQSGDAAQLQPAPGDRATLVQFSSDLCSSCGPARRVLSQLAQTHPGVVHVEINLTAHPELAGELRLLATPTTIVFAPDGTERGRITGAPRKTALRETLSDLLEPAGAVTA